MKDIKTKSEQIMKELLTISPSPVKTGQIVEGKIAEINKSNLFVNLGPLGTGIILTKEIKENPEIFKEVKVGEKVSCLVLEPENENGYIELSLKEAQRKLSWQSLEKAKKEEQSLKVKVIQANRGGLIVEILGIVGFLPVSHLSASHYPEVERGDKNKILEELNKFVGQELKVRIIDLNQREERLIVSEKILSRKTEKYY